MLEVHGSEPQMQKFYEQMKSDHFSMNDFMPMPKELEGTRSPMVIISLEEYNSQMNTSNKQDSLCLTQELSDKYKKEFGADNWYDWHCANWGTKWDVSFGSHTKDKEYYTAWFDTAWSPPVAFIEKLSEMFPDLQMSLKYQELGMCFQGELFCSDGNCSVEEDEVEFDEENEEIINCIFNR
jgi:hypothetical protein